MTTDSYIHAGHGCTMFVGSDAISLVRAITLVSALKMYAKHKMIITRGATPAYLLQLAATYTGKKYKRGQYIAAADDVQLWADTMRAALPVVHNSEAL